MPAPIVSTASPQSTLAGVVLGPVALLPSEFVVRRAYEGPQVIIEWNDALDPGDLVSFRLVRRLFGFPIDENDGEILFDGTPAANIISDLDVEACRCYYYKLFSFPNTGGVIFSEQTQGFIIPVQTGFFADKLFEILPEDFKIHDKGLEDATQIRLALAQAPLSGTDPEVFNLGEDGTELKGPLRRLLKLFGPVLDEAKGLVDCLLNQLDVDESCLSNLEHLAALLGLELNKELSPEKIRNEVRQQVEFLKLKGTIPGLVARFRSVSGLTPVIQEQCNNIFFLNDLACATLDFSVQELANINTENDTICSLVGFPDTIPFWLWFTVFVTLTPGFTLDEPTARKWCQAIDESSPTCHKGFLTIVTEDEDTIPVVFTDLQDDQDDLPDAMPIGMADQFDDVQVAFSAQWLIISDPTKTLNDPNFNAVFAVATIP